jgi:tRNA 2-thiouridine synthesizing protein A
MSREREVAMSAPSSIRLDMSGLACPLPLLGAKKMLDDLPDGQQLVLISDCPGTGDDLAAWAAETGHEVIAAEKTNGRRVAYTIRRRRPDARSGGSVVLDLRGATCPGPIVEARRLLRGMQPDEVLVLISNCPGAPADIEAWTEDGSVRLVDRFEPSPGVFEFYLSAVGAHREPWSGGR